MRRLTEVHRWVWCSAGACACGVLAIVLALTVHDHGTTSDPYCIRRCYTLIHVAGPGALILVGAPLVIGLIVFALLPFRHVRAGRFVDRAAWSLATLNCLVCLVCLFTSVWFALLPVAVLTVCAVVTAP